MEAKNLGTVVPAHHAHPPPLRLGLSLGHGSEPGSAHVGTGFPSASSCIGTEDANLSDPPASNRPGGLLARWLSLKGPLSPGW